MNEYICIVPYHPLIKQTIENYEYAIEWLDCSIENINDKQWNIIKNVESIHLKKYIYYSLQHYRIFEEPFTKINTENINRLLLMNEEIINKEWLKIFEISSVYRNPKERVAKFIIESLLENIQDKIRSRSIRIFSEKD